MVGKFVGGAAALAVMLVSGDARPHARLEASSVGGALGARLQQQAGSAAAAPSPQRAMLDTYCVTCHNQRLKTGDLMLDSITLCRAGS